VPGAGLRVIRNGISLVGAVIVTLTAVLFLVVFLADLFGLHTNPYIGILFFLLVPALFVAGLLLIPLGIWRERRRVDAGGAPRTDWPRLDLNDPHKRHVLFGVFVLTLANMVIVSLAAYRGIEFMDDPRFCGQVCHTPMEPQYVAHEEGPHSRVACVRCHIGPGAESFVRAKLDGTRRVVAVFRNNYSRPIASPHDLSPARELCEQCHWSEKFHGDKIVTVHEYANDEASTENRTTLKVHVGGGSERLGIATGIHWHMNLANEVEYIATDDSRQVIPYVRVKDRTGGVREYFADGVSEAQLRNGKRRRMDCMDCHNRPTHRFAPTPERAVDEAIGRGELSRTLPFVRREAVAALTPAYTDGAAAEREIAFRLTTFYRSRQGSGVTPDAIDRAVMTTQRLYARNVFPKMNVKWGTYANNIGHNDSPGCFRCHDDEHKSKEGQVIKQDCEPCHEDIS
jgi:hypothetical protein